MCLHCLFLLTLEEWKRGNVSFLSLSSNSGSVEVWKCGSVEVWKCGSVEMWKCGNMSSLSLSDNPASV